MASQFGEWLSGLNIGERPMMFPFIVIFRDVRILAERHLSKLKGLVCGTMFGSSAALPFLYPLDLKGLCLLDFGLFAGSAILFAVLHPAEIALYGHYPLIGSIAIATLILIFQRNSLEAFGSYIPVLVALGLLTAVHVVPWILAYFHQRNGITLGEHYMATRGNYPAASYHAVVDSGSFQSSEEFLGNFDRVWSPHPLELGHMHLNGGYPGTARPDSPPTSSLDLEIGLHQQAQPEAGPMHPFL